MHKYYQLSVQERYTLSAKLQAGLSISRIAKEMNRHKSTISRELKRNRQDGIYQHEQAEANAQKRRAVKRTWDAKNTGLADYICNQLLKFHGIVSVEEIARNLRECPTLPKVSHVSIYNAIDRNDSILAEARKCLPRRGIRRRRRKYPRGGSSRIIGRRSIHERPAHVDARTKYGHWEADTVRDGNKTYLTLVERLTRFSICREVSMNAQSVYETLLNIIPNSLVPFPIHPRKFKFSSITFDNGSEFAYAPKLASVFDETEIFFADPGHPEQRGSNENFNGLLRYFFPKHGRLPRIKCTLEEAVDKLNNKRRKILGWRSAREALLTVA